LDQRLESQLREDALVQRANTFLDVLLTAFPPLAHVAEDELTPEDLRGTSLLGSTTMLRVLAGAYQQLSEVQMFEDEDIAEFFARLSSHIGVPITAEASG
jgi:hypothetical protein